MLVADDLGRDRFGGGLPTCPADVQISVLPSDVIGLIAEVLRDCPDCAIHAHAGDGVDSHRSVASGAGDERG